jgi:hypothetical protein
VIIKTFIPFLIFIQLSFGNQYQFKNALLSKKVYRELHYSVFGKIEYTSLKKFKNIVQSSPKSKKDEVIKMINELSDHIPSKLLRPIIYWSKIDPNKLRLTQALEFSMIYKSFILRDAIQSPISTKVEKAYAYKLAEKIYHRKDLDTENFYSKLQSDFKDKSKFISNFEDTKSIVSAIKETDAISFSVDPNILKSYMISFQGFVPGNEVKLISKNGHSIKRMEWFKNNSNSFKMPETPNSKGHISFKKDPIFIKYRELIDDAKESIIIFTPLLGGSIGKTLTEYLIEKVKLQTKNNSNFKIIVSHPFNMTSRHSKEVGTLLINLKKTIANNPLLKRHFFLINSDVKESDFFKRSNNSRAIVIDGNSKYPQAYVGSKSLTDSEGGYSFDNMLWIKGPAAAHVQESLIDDINQSIEDKNQLDLINKTFSITRKEYPHAGIQSVRLSENITHQNINEIRNTIIDMIINAKESIYMDQRYLYDSHISDSLIKKKLEIPAIDIRILIDTNENFLMNGLPNTIFIRELKMYGINIRAKKTEHLKVNTSKDSFYFLNQLNNRKIISVDSKVLHIGSADLSPKSLEGSQRDLSIQIFDKSEISNFNKEFLVSWSDKEQSLVLDIQHFEAQIEGDTLSKEFSSLINSISKAFLKVKNELEEKF